MCSCSASQVDCVASVLDRVCGDAIRACGLAVALDCGDPSNKTEFGNYSIGEGNTSRYSRRAIGCRLPGFASAAGAAALEPLQCALDGTWNSTASWWTASVGCSGHRMLAAHDPMICCEAIRVTSDACGSMGRVCTDCVFCVDFAADECVNSSVCGAFACVNAFQGFVCGVGRTVQRLLLARASCSVRSQWTPDTS